MDGIYEPYDWFASADRINDILDQPARGVEDAVALPTRDRITRVGGCYGTCSALFVDVHASPALTGSHPRPVLAKIYRAFASEMVAVLNGHERVREVDIVGHRVWAVYDTRHRTDIDALFDVAVTANSTTLLLNTLYAKRGFGPLDIGIGVDYGRALMVRVCGDGPGRAGVVYMGDVFDRAGRLARKAGRVRHGVVEPPIWVGKLFHDNLDDRDRTRLRHRDDDELGIVYTGWHVGADKKRWIDRNG
ncbi:adenylate/guanylate cyclase domain-containing protein [Rhodococcus sp. HNM0569]|uniref:adenylate/guanylate cyclase domain-containing protein n=1 Tax=Rhodococcus sp. HNM0569 TaxID=2716340 RepID=UPI00146C8D96|nr:adenylate/guanylate cyclase domain-containing protein [Rhodococcus sp. HNM0569]NLU82544.1 adenylate/guanylate cyclase domain-containing protein [Rhodococcus sp. HNM0569]